MQLAFDAVDRLVELLEERAAPLPAADAARFLFASRSVPDGLANDLVSGIVAGELDRAPEPAHPRVAGDDPRDKIVRETVRN